MMLITSSVLFVLLSFASCQELRGVDHGPSGSDPHTHGDVRDLGSVLENLGSGTGTGGSSTSSSGGVPDIASIDVNVVGSSSGGSGVPDLVDASASTRDQGPRGFDSGPTSGNRIGGGSGFDQRGFDQRGFDQRGFDQRGFNQRGMDPRDFRRFDRGRGEFGRGGGFTDIGRMDRGGQMGRDGPMVPYFMGGEPAGPGRREAGLFFDGPGSRPRDRMDPDFGMGMRPEDRTRGMGDRGFGGPRSDRRGGFRDMGARGFDGMEPGRFRDPMGRRPFDGMGTGRFDGMRSGRMPDMGPGMGLGPDSFMGSSRRTGGGFDRQGASFDGMGGGFDRPGGSFDGMGGGFDRRRGGSMGPMDRAGGMMTGGSGMQDSMGGGFFNESSGMSGDMGGRGRGMGSMSGGDRRGMDIFPGMDGRSSGMRSEPRFAMDPRFAGDRFSRLPDMGRIGGRGDFSRGSFPAEYYSPYGFSSRMSRFASFGSPVSAPYPTPMPPYASFSGGMPIRTLF